MNLKRLESETSTQHLLRLVGYKIDDKEDIDWSEIVEYCGLQGSAESLRKAMQHSEFGAYAIYKYMLEQDVGDDIIESLEQKKREVRIEIQKLRDLRTGDRERERVQSRKESVIEEIREAIDNIKPLEIPSFKPIGDYETKMIGGVADVHFGKELVINGLMGEEINVFNEDIFQQRMINLLGEYIDIIQEEGISKLYFFNLGDALEGLLRVSALQHIKYGSIEASIKFARFMSTWLNTLSEYVEIEYYGTLGNHDEVRPLGSKSGDFPKENMGYVIDEMISLSLSNNDRVNVNPTQKLQYVDIDGYKVLATHGQEERNLVSSVKEYKEIYNVDIDLMISGHLHNSKQETASMNSKVVQFPSIVGIDSYSMKLKKTAKAEGKAILVKGNRFVNIDIDLQ